MLLLLAPLGDVDGATVVAGVGGRRRGGTTFFASKTS